MDRYEHRGYRYLGAERSTFFVPSDLEQQLATSGSRDRYQIQFERFGKMEVPDARLFPLVSLLHRHQKGYDQEGYITGSENYELNNFVVNLIIFNFVP